MKTMNELYTFRCAECGRNVHLGTNDSKVHVDRCPGAECESRTYYSVDRADPITDTITGEEYGPGLVAPDVEDHIDGVGATYVMYYDDPTALSFIVDDVRDHLNEDVANSLTKSRLSGIVEYVIRTKFTHLDPP